MAELTQPDSSALDRSAILPYLPSLSYFYLTGYSLHFSRAQSPVLVSCSSSYLSVLSHRTLATTPIDLKSECELEELLFFTSSVSYERV